MKTFIEYITEGKKEVYPDAILLWTTGFMQILTKEDDNKYRISYEATRRNPKFRFVAKQPIMDKEPNRDVQFIKDKIKTTGAKIRLMTSEAMNEYVTQNKGRSMRRNFDLNNF